MAGKLNVYSLRQMKNKSNLIGWRTICSYQEVPSHIEFILWDLVQHLPHLRSSNQLVGSLSFSLARFIVKQGELQFIHMWITYFMCTVLTSSHQRHLASCTCSRSTSFTILDGCSDILLSAWKFTVNFLQEAESFGINHLIWNPIHSLMLSDDRSLTWVTFSNGEH